MDNFFIRSPLFSLNEYNRIFDSHDPYKLIIHEFQENRLFNLAIYISSKSFHNRVRESILNEPNSEKKLKIGKTLLKYFSRMSTRSTPFGLNAGIQIGEFSQSISVLKDVDLNQIKVEIDGLDYYSLVEKLIESKELIRHLTFKLNNTLMQFDDRVVLIERFLSDSKFEYSLSKISCHDILNEILSIDDLIIQFSTFRKLQVLSEYDDEEILAFYRQCIASQILVPTYCLSSSQELSVKFLSDLQKSLPEGDSKISLKRELSDYTSMVNKIEKSFIDKDYDSIKFCIDQISGNDYIRKTNFNLYSTQIFQISKEWKGKIFSAINELTILRYRKFDDSIYNNYLKRFKELYDDRLIPLTDIFYTNKDHFKYQEVRNSGIENIEIEFGHSSKKEEFDELQQVALDLYIQWKDTSENILDIKKLKTNIQKRTPKLTFQSLLATISILSRNVNVSKFEKIYLKGLSVNACSRNIGRFSYIDPMYKKITHSIISHECRQSNILYAEIINISQPRLRNIVQRSHPLPFEIAIYDDYNPSKEKIQLQDLYVGVVGDEFILYSKKHKKRVIPKLSAAQNFTFLTPDIIHFLSLLQDDKFIHFWDWSALPNLDYYPRVVSGDIILSPAQWVLTKDEIESKDKLKEWILTKSLPRFVQIIEGSDLVMSLDLTSSFGLDYLFDLLYQYGRLKVQEAIEMNYKDDNEDTISSLLNEIQIPYLFNSEAQHTPELSRISFDEPRSFKPGSQWLYLRLYDSLPRLDSLLTGSFYDILCKLKSENKIESYFFIRYKDRANHIRLRLKMLTSIDEVLALLNPILSGLDKLEIGTYDRELERYAKNSSYRLSEEIFHWDSNCVLELIKLEGNSNLKRWQLAITGVDSYFNMIELEYNQRLKILGQIKDFYEKFLNVKGKSKKQITRFYRDHFKDILEAFENNELILIYKKREDMVKPLLIKIAKDDLEENLKSYIHMFNNRIFAESQNKFEFIIYDLLTLYYKQKISLEKYA